MKKYNLSKIMKRAWELVKKAGMTISAGLKKSWEEAKMTIKGTEKQIAWRNDIIEKMHKEFDELRKKINLAEGIPEILQKNIKIGGKYIVFIPITNQEKTCFLEDEDRNSIDDKTSKKLIKKYSSLAFLS